MKKKAKANKKKKEKKVEEKCIDLENISNNYNVGLFFKKNHHKFLYNFKKM